MVRLVGNSSAYIAPDAWKLVRDGQSPLSRRRKAVRQKGSQASMVTEMYGDGRCMGKVQQRDGRDSFHSASSTEAVCNKQ